MPALRRAYVAHVLREMGGSHAATIGVLKMARSTFYETIKDTDPPQPRLVKEPAIEADEGEPGLVE